MKRIHISISIVYLLVTAILAGCDSIPFINNESDYKGASRSKPLEVPPDLTASPVSDAYSIPGNASYSSYSQAQDPQEARVEKVLTNPEGVRLEKSGTQRWLVVNAPVEKVWPVIREFWIEQGFAVRSENPQTGVMETEWIDADKIKKDDSGNFGDKFDKWLDSLSGFSDKKKFRTRLDRGNEANISEIYMTHRSVSGAPDDGKEKIKTQLGEIDNGYRADAKNRTQAPAYDAELDAELLRRLMVRLGIDERKSNAVVAQGSSPKRASIVSEGDDEHDILVLNDSFDRAWRRVGLALDRIGFVIEDKNRASGVFFVRYADTELNQASQKEGGLLKSLKFWSNDDNKKTSREQQYRIKVTDAGKSRSAVKVITEEGEDVNSDSASRIIELIYNQLK